MSSLPLAAQIGRRDRVLGLVGHEPAAGSLRNLPHVRAPDLEELLLPGLLEEGPQRSLVVVGPGLHQALYGGTSDGEGAIASVAEEDLASLLDTVGAEPDDTLHGGGADHDLLRHRGEVVRGLGLL